MKNSITHCKAWGDSRCRLKGVMPMLEEEVLVSRGKKSF